MIYVMGYICIKIITLYMYQINMLVNLHTISYVPLIYTV